MPTLTSTSEDTRVYECAVLYPYPISQKEEQDVLKEVEKHFSEVGAKQMSKDLWGRRGLAYPIKKSNEGCFVIYHYELDPSKLKELDISLRITHGVLRHMFVKPPKGYEVIKYSENYEAWLKEGKDDVGREEKEKEEELQKQVADKAKRQVRRAKEEKKESIEEKTAVPIEQKKLDEELEKLISDDELDI